MPSRDELNQLCVYFSNFASGVLPYIRDGRRDGAFDPKVEAAPQVTYSHG